MFLQKLELTNYRNFSKASFEFNKDITLFIGPNGLGKTNILEAIFYLCTLRSFRGVRDSAVIRRGASIGRIAAKLLFERNEAESRNSEIALVLTGGGKIAFRGGKKIPPAKIIGTIKAVVFAPEMLAIVAGPPVLRRRELDLLLSQISYRYLYWLVQYQRVLRRRNALLRSPTSNKQKLGQLELWDSQLIEAGQEVTRRRKIALAALSEQTGGLFNELTGRVLSASQQKLLTIAYFPSAAAESFAADTLKARQIDLKYKQTTVGPHRDDWRFYLGGIDLSGFGSRGEMRSAVLSFKIASAKLLAGDVDNSILRAESRSCPLLLLDDVLSELDLQKNAALHRLISEHQTIITATDAEKIPESILEKAKTYRLD